MTYDTRIQESKEEIAQQLAEWRNAFVVAGFSDPEALQLVRDIHEKYATGTQRSTLTQRQAQLTEKE
jgi:Asp/Glu/hydantoin racemase